MTNKEVFLKLVSENDTETLEEIKERIKKRKKMTAVEWFFEQLTEVDYNCINKTFLRSDNSLAGYKLRELFSQAKAMEKEQIEKAFDTEWSKEIRTGEQYYNETYNK